MKRIIFDKHCDFKFGFQSTGVTHFIQAILLFNQKMID